MSNGYRVLSLFDGMGCAHLAMQEAGLPISRYVSFEIDRFCNEVVAHNFPDAEQRGDVFDADFTEFEGFDLLMGGSPCTYWSVAQSADRREVTASGVGWELFQQYVRALREARPRWFIYENNKSMSRAIRDSISEAFGFGPVHIDSALVSAQHRQRLYWVGRREEDGTYSQVRVEQPTDRRILLRDVLETGGTWQDKSYPLRATYASQGASPGYVEFTMKHHDHTKAVEPLEYRPPEDYDVVVTDRNIRATTAGPSGVSGTAQGYTVMLPDSKTNAMTAGQCHKSKVIEPVPMCVAQRGRYVGSGNKSHSDGGPTEQHFESRGQKTNALTTVQKDNMAAMPIGAESAKSTGNPIYEVTNGEIEIRGRKYPIKLLDGRYIIRKFTVRECMRLQTVPEWYDFSCVSKTQAYKMLGNGWTVQVIVHLLRSIMEGEGDAD